MRRMARSSSIRSGGSLPINVARSVATVASSGGTPFGNERFIPKPTTTAIPDGPLVASARMPTSFRSSTARAGSGRLKTSFGHFSPTSTLHRSCSASDTAIPVSSGSSVRWSGFGRSRNDTSNEELGVSSHGRPWRPRPALWCFAHNTRPSLAPSEAAFRRSALVDPVSFTSRINKKREFAGPDSSLSCLTSANHMGCLPNPPSKKS